MGQVGSAQIVSVRPRFAPSTTSPSVTCGHLVCAEKRRVFLVGLLARFGRDDFGVMIATQWTTVSMAVPGGCDLNQVRVPFDGPGHMSVDLRLKTFAIQAGIALTFGEQE